MILLRSFRATKYLYFVAIAGLVLRSFSGAGFAQAPRPPTSFLSQLSDVVITSPTDNQPLVWNASLSKWDNSNALNDIILGSTTLTTTGIYANFSSAKLTHPAAGDVIDWSSGNLKVLKPLQDTSNVTAENISNRQLLGADGTTVKIDWSGGGIQFPTLGNGLGPTTGFLTTDSAGNVSLAPVPSAGSVATTTNILAGDGSGNAISTSPALVIAASGLNAQGANNGDFLVDWWNTTANVAATAGVQLKNANGVAQIKLFGSSNTGTGILASDDLWIRNDIATTGDVVISTNAGVTKFSNNAGTTERARIGNGLAVGTATDPGVGIVNASTGYRIGNVDLAQVYMNGSAAGATGFAANQAIPGSVITIPAGAWKTNGSYHCVFDMTKTAAGTAAIVITLHMGTAGTVADASIGTITFAAGTAAADSGLFDMYVTFKSVGSGTSAVIAIYSRLTKVFTTTGLVNNGGQVAATSATSAGFNSTTPTKISLGFNGGASFAGTNFFVQTEYKQ